MASLKKVLKAPLVIGRRYALLPAIHRYDRRSDETGQVARSGLRGGMLKSRIDDLLETPGLTDRMVASPLHVLPQGGKRVHFSWDIPAFLWQAVLGSARLQAVVTDYLGPQVRLDDLYVKTVLDGLSSVSEGWHDDNVGYRLKLFMVFDTAGRPSGTVVAPTERPHLYRIRLGDELRRFMGRPATAPRATETRVAYDRGDALLFDTNIPHRGDYSSGEGVRYCVIAEFIDRDKADALRGRAPCGPGQAQQRIRIPALDGIDPAAHPLIDGRLLDRDRDGWLYGYRDSGRGGAAMP